MNAQVAALCLRDSAEECPAAQPPGYRPPTHQHYPWRVDGEYSADHPVTFEDRDVAALAALFDDRDPAVGARPPHHLDPVAVLIGPDVGRGGGRPGRSHDGGGDDLAVLAGVRPVLD